MGILRLPGLTQSSQPQQIPQIDWANPLTRGLVFCVPGVAGNYDDIVGKRKGTLGGFGVLGRQVNANGSFPLFSNQYFDYPAFGSELPAAGPGTIAFIDQPVAPSGYSTTIDFLPFGATQEVMIYQSLSDAGYNFSTGPRGASAPRFSAVGQTVAGVNRRFVVRSAALNSVTPTDWNVFLGATKLFSDSTSSLTASAVALTRLGGRSDGGTDPWEGALGQVVIWNRALTDTEALSYNANPWQIFKAPRRTLMLSASTNVSAAMAWLEVNDTASITATASVTGSVSWTETSDTSSIVASVKASGIVAWSEATDTVAISATATVNASAAWTEANDTAAISVSVGNDVAASATWTETNDTTALLATVRVSAAAGWAEQADLTGFSAQVLVNAGLSWTEQSDAVTITAAVAAGGAFVVPYVPSSRTVDFGGGTNTVAFDGGTNTVNFNV